MHHNHPLSGYVWVLMVPYYVLYHTTYYTLMLLLLVSVFIICHSLVGISLLLILFVPFSIPITRMLSAAISGSWSSRANLVFSPLLGTYLTSSTS